jgi:hypothetical protein
MIPHVSWRCWARVGVLGIAVAAVGLVLGGVAAGRAAARFTSCATRLAGMSLPSKGEGFYNVRTSGISCAAVRRVIESAQLRDDGAFHAKAFACVTRPAPFHFLWYESFTPTFPGFGYSCHSTTRAPRRFSFGWNGIHYCPALTSTSTAPTFETNQSFSRYMSCHAIDAAEQSATLHPGLGAGSLPTLSAPGFSCLETIILAEEDAVCLSPPYAVQPTKKVFGVILDGTV